MEKNRAMHIIYMNIFRHIDEDAYSSIDATHQLSWRSVRNMDVRILHQSHQILDAEFNTPTFFIRTAGGSWNTQSYLCPVSSVLSIVWLLWNPFSRLQPATLLHVIPLRRWKDMAFPPMSTWTSSSGFLFGWQHQQHMLHLQDSKRYVWHYPHCPAATTSRRTRFTGSTHATCCKVDKRAPFDILLHASRPLLGSFQSICFPSWHKGRFGYLQHSSVFGWTSSLEFSLGDSRICRGRLCSTKYLRLVIQCHWLHWWRRDCLVARRIVIYPIES